MKSINNAYTDPYFNIAAEKYLFQSAHEDVFMMYQNEPSVIIGRHQNAEKEVDMDFAQKNRIKIARRISGGGAVFHDMGNVNVTFIERNSTCDFNKFTRMLVDFLATIGIEAKENTRLGIEIGGLKISGSAQYIYKETMLFHATLLFSSDLEMLEKVLLKNTNEPQDKHVSSFFSSVTNICEHLSTPMEIENFKEAIMNYFLGEVYVLNRKDILAIEKLKNKDL